MEVYPKPTIRYKRCMQIGWGLQSYSGLSFENLQGMVTGVFFFRTQASFASNPASL